MEWILILFFLTTDFSQSYTELLNRLTAGNKKILFSLFLFRAYPCLSVVNTCNLIAEWNLIFIFLTTDLSRSYTELLNRLTAGN